MKRLFVIALCACRPATTPAQPTAPLPPTEQAAASAKPAEVAWPAFPAIAALPASHPTGDPISVPFTLPKVGEAELQTTVSSFEQHYVYPGGTRYQKTERNLEVRVKTLEVTGDHASKIEVVANAATEAVAVGSTPDTAPRQEETVLFGTYIVTPGKGGGFERDEANVHRPGGAPVYGREQEELGSMYGDVLRDGFPFVRFLRTKQLRLGESVPLDDEGKRAIVGADPVPGTYLLTLVSADAGSVTFQLDVESPAVRLQGSVMLDRKTGRFLEQRQVVYKTERTSDTSEETFRTYKFTFMPLAR